MHNLSMKRKLEKGEALDVSKYPRNHLGDYVLPHDLVIEDLDLCDGDREAWIWSVGRCKCCGTRIASTSSKFYTMGKDPEYVCEWLR